MSKDNPYIKNIPGTCTVCGKIAFFDQFGNGTCSHCGWEMSKNEETMSINQGCSYPMLVPVWRAREQYKQGKPFKATFEDFVNGLWFSMAITYWECEVFFRSDSHASSSSESGRFRLAAFVFSSSETIVSPSLTTALCRTWITFSWKSMSFHWRPRISPRRIPE